MSYWDTSALAKLSLAEPDSAQFEELAAATARIVTSLVGMLELRTVYGRREAEGALPAGEAAVLSSEMEQDSATGQILVQRISGEVEREFAVVLEKCFSQRPPVFVRTNDALHLASARIAGETDFITADGRQRAAAELMGFNVLP